MCSPSPKKERSQKQASKVTSAKKTPAKKSSSAKYSKSPRRGLPNNTRQLNFAETIAMNKFLQKNPGFVGCRTFNELPGKPHITVSPWEHSEKAPFGLIIRATRSKYIPPGDEGNKVILKLNINTTKEKGFNVNDSAFISRIVYELSSGFFIVGGEDRVEKMFKSATLLKHLDNYSTQDEATEIVIHLRDRFLQMDDNKVAKNADVACIKSLLNLRPLCLNKELRTTNHNSWANQQAGEIDSYLETLPVHTGVCYRGVCTEGLSDSLLKSWIVPGNHYTDAAFTTASLSPLVAWKYAGSKPRHRLVFEITSCAGRIVPIGGEHEISFKKGKDFLIKSVDLNHPSDDSLRHVLVRLQEIQVDDDDH
eukprot:scaffold1410_cov154-Amphora_coffeaeformis.AAC.11